ncbi:ABC transporter substrate-binding protein [Frankia sp. Ag45/Mut15]|uniref:ABC transporter substrate-binding protein n=1 Tax=Frankia umida TaxID=573489 RepID=A0ABT0JZB6_9ACTN|nr:ABC transporter substrate-binding protein [Frankia umida]MCK9876890.1 ABC transporter substrate-binding protein [Frankia umida]
MRRHRRSHAAARAVITCVLVAVTGCGAHETSDAGQPGGRGDTAVTKSLLRQVAQGGYPCATTPGVDRDTIRLGMVYSGSPSGGPGDTGGDPSAQFRAGVDARLGEQNALGGVDGRRLTYRIEDDHGIPTRNAAAGRSLTGAGDALGILRFSSASGGGAPELAAAAVPVVDGHVSDPGAATRTNVFSYSRPMGMSPASSGWGDFLYSRGARRVATVAVQLSDGTQAMAAAAQRSARAAGMRVAASLLVSPGPLDGEKLVEQIRAADADSVIAFVPAPTFYAIATAAHNAALGLTAILGDQTTYSKNELAAAGTRAAGVYTFVDYAPFELAAPAHQRFRTALTTYAPQAATLADGNALIGWISADLLLTGVRAAGHCPTRAALLTALRTLDHYDAGGLLLAPINPAKGLAAATACYDYLRVNKDGATFTPVSATPRCGRTVTTE